MNPLLSSTLLTLHLLGACVWTGEHLVLTGIALRFGGFPFFS